MIDAWKAFLCVRASQHFETEREALGLPWAVNRLRSNLVGNDLWITGDEALMADILAGKLESVGVAEALCKTERMKPNVRTKQ